MVSFTFGEGERSLEIKKVKESILSTLINCHINKRLKLNIIYSYVWM